MLLAAPPLRAFDPGSDWQTLSTPHFRVHYAAGSYRDALAVARAAEAVYGELTERLAWTPEGATHILVVDEQDVAQGFAQPVPHRVVTVNASLPDEASGLSDFRDYRSLLLAHELTHIVHMDTMHGLPAAVNTVFGALLVPNGAQPRWFTEGLAVYFESVISGAGRARSPFSAMMLRAALLDDAFVDLGRLSGSTWYWPQGAVPYVYGGAFLDYLAERFGERALRAISHEYGSRLIPWTLNLTVEKITGHTYDDLFADFVARQKLRALREVSRIDHLGRVEGERLTHRGQDMGAPRVGPDGTVYVVEEPLGGHAVLRAVERGGGERVVSEVFGDASLAVAPDGAFALVAQRETYAVYRSYSDLFRVDLRTGEHERLTSGARVRDPDVAPDGRRVVFVQSAGGHAVLRLATLPDLADVRTLVDLGPEAWVWGPRFSPDGASVAFVGQLDGQRDVFVVPSDASDRGEASVRRVTQGPARDGGPSFTRDGRFLLYHSDRDGVFNLYAAPLPFGPHRRVTRVATGAFHPEASPDGAAVYYRAYGSTGFDLARLEVHDWDALPLAGAAPPSIATPPLDGPTAPPLDAPAPPLDAPTAPPLDAPTAPSLDALTAPSLDAPTAPPLDAQQRPAAPPPSLSADVYPSEPYSPWSTLLPRAWLPVTGLDARGTTAGVAVTGGDVVGEHAYSLQILWGAVSGALAFDAVYDNRQFHPGLTLALSHHLQQGPLRYVRNRRGRVVDEDTWTARLATRVPLWRERELDLSLYAGYEMVVRQNVDPFEVDPEDFGVQRPDEGRFASLRLELTLVTTRRYGDSISDEEGGRLSVSTRVEHPYLGSEYGAVSGQLRYAHFLPNPWIERHVLAVSASAGWGASTYARRRLFAVAGLPQRDLVLDLLGYRVGADGLLRGFPQARIEGDVMVQGSLEYRLPIFDVQTGYDTLPLFVNGLHGAVFADGAALADAPDTLGAGQHYSIGVELRLGLLLAYVVPVTVRFGWGHGLGSDSDVNEWFLVIDQGY